MNYSAHKGTGLPNSTADASTDDLRPRCRPYTPSLGSIAGSQR
ncbi:protein of unknown function [Limnospira indica PCC 8005]|uniref:Uncharacterized protein n=1 Tax=Limnospira indica PCC 8005 TaxID=376219 RepID=A0A9P1KCH8_9CYAN|nr:protein of unknown function [Limnospira indica PCC 8005]